MFKKVLIATDSSPVAKVIISCVAELHQLGTEQALIAQYFMVPEQVAFPEETKTHIEASLEPFRESLSKKGFSVKLVVEPGLPALEIPNLAEQEECSLIIIGSRGHNFSSELFLGGTAAEILHRVSQPLLIIRIDYNKETGGAICAGEPCDFMRHILCPTDFSDHSEYAFQYLLEIAAKGAKQITLLHTQDINKLQKHHHHKIHEFDIIDRRRLEVLKARLEKVSEASISLKLSHGAPIEEILKQDKDASLIIMGTHGRGYISELFMGSISHHTARHASSPVFLIRKPFKKLIETLNIKEK